MAILFLDGFDHYRKASDMLASQYWTTATTYSIYPAFSTPRFSGRSVSPDTLTLSMNANLATGMLGFGVRFSRNADTRILEFDSSNVNKMRVQFIVASGVLRLDYWRDVSPVGWVTLAETNPGLISMDTWYFVEFKWQLTSGTQTGNFKIRIDNVLALNATGLVNFSLPTTGSVNQAKFMSIWDASIDDLYLADTTVTPGLYPNNDFIGDKRVYTMFPKNNDSVMFTPTPSYTTQSPFYYDSRTFTHAANRLWFCRFITDNDPIYVSDDTYTVRIDPAAFVAQTDGVLTHIEKQLNATYPTAKIKFAIYGEDPLVPNTPKTLLATSDEIIGTVTGVNTFPMGSGALTIEKGKKYWVAFVSDTTLVLRTPENWTDNYGVEPNLYVASTYPAVPSTLTQSLATPTGSWYETSLTRMVIATSTNYQTVQEIETNRDSNNVAGVTGSQDTFGTDGTIVPLAAVYGLQVVGLFKKDEANARTICNVIKSGATLEQGPDTNASANFSFKETVFSLNPATGTTWSVAEANAAKIGYKITS